MEQNGIAFDQIIVGGLYRIHNLEDGENVVARILEKKIYPEQSIKYRVNDNGPTTYVPFNQVIVTEANNDNNVEMGQEGGRRKRQARKGSRKGSRKSRKGSRKGSRKH